MSTERGYFPSIASEYFQRIGTQVFLGSPNNEIQNDPDYQIALSIIQDIYRDVWRWHGTGRYQYLPPDYYGVIDILASIGIQGGLVPHYDPLDYVTGPMYSVSTSPSRLYASLYAQPHYEKGKKIRHPVMTAAGWMFYLKEMVKKDKRLLDKNFRMKNGLRGEPAAYFHKKYTHAHVRDRELFLGGVSDIPGNYPMIIGIKEGAFPEVEIADTLSGVESRSHQPILVDAFTHIEVPFEYVEEVYGELQVYDLKIPVFPIKWGDEYSKSIPLKRVLYGISNPSN